MLHTTFPVLVSIIPDALAARATVYLHRKVAVLHTDSGQCECIPHRFTSEEISRLSADDLNMVLRADVQ
jgi:hypothetical protein